MQKKSIIPRVASSAQRHIKTAFSVEKNRYLTDPITADLLEKMVFLGGPRQVGKTTLARNLVGPAFQSSAYFNWDNRQDRRQILDLSFPTNAELIILDEIHKYRTWKNLIKGEYDVNKGQRKYLITGSARLNVYRRGGDSLQGRYHYHTLHPFSVAEVLRRHHAIEPLGALPIESEDNEALVAALERFGGFPEVFLKQDTRALRRWHNEKTERLFREDIRDLEPIRDLSNMQLLGDMLPGKVGSLLSVNAMREDLEVSHRSVSAWLDILEAFYYQFRIYPYRERKIRSIKKEPKLYLIDWSEVSDPGARFENLIASHLLKFVQFLNENEGHRVELGFLRNVDKKEVDFLVTVDKKPWFCVEAKYKDKTIDKSLRYFQERLDIPFVYQVVRTPGVDVVQRGVHIVSAGRFLAALV